MSMFFKNSYFRGIISYLFANLLIYSGEVRKAKQAIFRNQTTHSLYFHNPSKKTFEKTIKWLINNKFSFCTSKEIIKFINSSSPLPKGKIWLTFDDGWKLNKFHVIPILIKNKIPATFFINSGIIKNNGLFWWEILKKRHKILPSPLDQDYRILWKLSESKRKKVMDFLFKYFSKDFMRQAMTIDDIKSLSKYEYIEFGSHTVNHVLTPNCNLSQLSFELRKSKEEIEELTGKTVSSFSYPNGDYSSRDIEVLRKQNYSLAATTESRGITKKDNIYLVPRFSGGLDNISFQESLCRSLCIWDSSIEKFKNIIRN